MDAKKGGYHMNSIYIFGLLFLTAYFIQVAMGIKQMKHFNQHYQELRKLGKVAIGRRAGKVKAGTIFLFAVDPKGSILAARKMQGVTVLAKFHSLPQYVGEDIHYMDHYHPLVRQENKLTQQAIENAREVYLRVGRGDDQEFQSFTWISSLKIQLQLWKNKVRSKLKGSAE